MSGAWPGRPGGSIRDGAAAAVVSGTAGVAGVAGAAAIASATDDGSATASAAGTQAPADSPHPPRRPRNRIRFSCTTCRDKKLKCNRLLPCDQCEKRGLAPGCRYVPYLYPRHDRPGASAMRLSEWSVRSGGVGDGLGDGVGGVSAFPGPLESSYGMPPVEPSPWLPYQGLGVSAPAVPQMSGQTSLPLAPAEPLAPRDPQRYHQQPHPPPHDHAMTVHERLRYLEHLVAVLRDQAGESPPAPGDVVRTVEAPDIAAGETAAGETGENAGSAETGTMVSSQRYIDAANWEGVLADVVKMTENLVVMDGDYESDDEDAARGTAPDPSPEPDRAMSAPADGLALLSGGFPRVAVAEVLRYLPPRPVTDAMIARFFEGREPAWMMFHQPTFYRHYDAFWRTREASYSYLALLFMMLAHAAIFCLRDEESSLPHGAAVVGTGLPSAVPGPPPTPLAVIDACRARAAHCLALDDISRPGRHKVEAMALYFGTEYLRQADAPQGTAMVLSIALRLAMHMGYHRDPAHFRGTLTPFDGEMRRRTWAVLTEIDKIVSFEFGLPAVAKAEDCDTALPRNLYDADLAEDMAELPPSRPETERTPALYTICKARLMAVFGDIAAMRAASLAGAGAASRRSQRHYEEDVLVLDRRLREAYAGIAQPLRFPEAGDAASEDNAAVPVDLLLQRYLLDLLYHKARLVLHRRFLGVARSHARYAPSRWACVDAASRILRHQYAIYAAMQPGGRLARERWFVNSTSTHDFLLADMVLCVEVSYARQTGLPDPSVAGLLDLLRMSRGIWATQRHASAEANRAFHVLSQMLAASAGDPAKSERSERRKRAAFGSDGVATSASSQAYASTSPSTSQPLQYTPSSSPEDMAHNMPPPPPPPPDAIAAFVPPFTATAMDSVSQIAQAGWPVLAASATLPAAAPLLTPAISGFAGLKTVDSMPNAIYTAGAALDDAMEDAADPSYVADWWDSQLQHASADTMQVAWSALFAGRGPAA